MRARSGLLPLACTAVLLAAGCSSQVAGTPVGVTSAAVQTSSASGDGAARSGGASDATDATSIASDVPSFSDGGSASSNNAEPTGSLPTDLADLTSLAGLPGLGAGCLTAAGIAMGFGMLMIAPMLGGAEVTKSDVDQAFANLGDVPPELTDAVDVLHKAAVAATGQPLAKAADILGSPEVTRAMDELSAYTDAKCGG